MNLVPRHPMQDFSSNPVDTVWKDVLLHLVLCMTVMMVLLILMPKNPKTSDAEDSRTRGNVRVELLWPHNINADVDLWVQAPGQKPVGYSNRNGLIFNLFRDDLGNTADVTGINYELAYSRGLPSGEWVVNVHLYKSISGVTEIPIKIMIAIQEDDSGESRKPLIKIPNIDMVLRGIGTELTVIRFKLDEHGKIIPGSMNNIPKSLRSGL